MQDAAYFYEYSQQDSRVSKHTAVLNNAAKISPIIQQTEKVKAKELEVTPRLI